MGAKAAEHGLAGLSGSAGEVGVVGYTLGGGFGWPSRKHGLACNSVVSFDVVTADGDLVRASADSEPDLFWALRGGGGSFGVVTAIEFSLVPLAEVYAGMIAWPAARGAEVIPAYLEWVEGLPEEMSAWARFLTLPPLPEVPEPLRNTPLVDVTAAFAGPESEGAELIRPLLDLGEPMMNTFATIPAAGLSALNGDPEDPVPGPGRRRPAGRAARRGRRGLRGRGRAGLRQPAAVGAAAAPGRRARAPARGRRAPRRASTRSSPSTAWGWPWARRPPRPPAPT